MNKIPYQMTVRWSDVDGSYEAEVPALRTCIAYGDTPEEALRELIIAAELWLEAAQTTNKPIPKADISLEKFSQLAPVLNISAVAREANISVQTLATKMKRGTPFTDAESTGIFQVLEAHGIH